MERIPVYLLTGYLGSGKTSLLKAWLAQPELKDAALIINELGEVGLDNQLLASATESSSLVANACICCTGLPGLEEALEELFWARLHKRIPAFPCLVIETTGLAEPAPVAQAMASTDLLKERYQLAGVITCLSASTAREVLQHHAQARAQLAGADLLVITKTDLIPLDALQTLRQQLHHQQPGLRVAESSRVNLSCADMLALLKPQAHEHQHTPKHLGEGKHSAQVHNHADQHALGHGATHDHDHAHTHDARAKWLALPKTISESALKLEIEKLRLQLGPALLRLKGRVQTEQGPRLIQLAPFDPHPEISPDPVTNAGHVPANEQTAWGLTLIVTNEVSDEVGSTMEATLLKGAAS